MERFKANYNDKTLKFIDLVHKLSNEEQMKLREWCVQYQEATINGNSYLTQGIMAVISNKIVEMEKVFNVSLLEQSQAGTKKIDEFILEIINDAANPSGSSGLDSVGSTIFNSISDANFWLRNKDSIFITEFKVLKSGIRISYQVREHTNSVYQIMYSDTTRLMVSQGLSSYVSNWKKKYPDYEMIKIIQSKTSIGAPSALMLGVGNLVEHNHYYILFKLKKNSNYKKGYFIELVSNMSLEEQRYLFELSTNYQDALQNTDSYLISGYYSLLVKKIKEIGEKNHVVLLDDLATQNNKVKEYITELIDFFTHKTE